MPTKAELAKQIHDLKGYVGELAKNIRSVNDHFAIEVERLNSARARWKPKVGDEVLWDGECGAYRVVAVHHPVRFGEQPTFNISGHWKAFGVPLSELSPVKAKVDPRQQSKEHPYYTSGFGELLQDTAAYNYLKHTGSRERDLKALESGIRAVIDSRINEAASKLREQLKKDLL